MNASALLRRHWRNLPDNPLHAELQRSRDCLDAFAQATQASGSLLQSWIGGDEVVAFDHYPPSDVIDIRRGSQFYYHAHRDGGREHGHLHLFWHATASGKRRYLSAGRARWQRTSPTHLFAISLDARGLPVGLFTVNRWVTDGHWIDASTTLSMVDRFDLGATQEHVHSCRWLTLFVKLYRPVIEQLLVRRDQRLGRRASLADALQDRRLEILSQMSIDWAADLDAIQTLAALRR